MGRRDGILKEVVRTMEKTWTRQGDKKDTNARGDDDDPRNKMSMDLIYAPSLYEMTPGRMTKNTGDAPRQTDPEKACGNICF